LHTIDLDDFVANQLARVSYAQQRLWLRRVTVSLAAITGLSMLGVILIGEGWWIPLVVGVAMLLSGAGLVIYERAYRKRSPLREQLQAGLRGQRLLPQMLSGLSDDYFLINNLNLPGRADDIDHVLVGPNGIFALETKHHRGRIFCRDGQWYQSKISRAGHLQPESPIRDPTQQLKRNVDYLRSCINRTDRPLSRRTALWIEGLVVFTHPAVSLDLPETVLADAPFSVIRARDVPSYVRDHVPRRYHNKTEVRQMVSMLAHLKPGGFAQKDS
jgi:hypothetical protein